MVFDLAVLMEQWTVDQLADGMVRVKAAKMDSWTAVWKVEL